MLWKIALALSALVTATCAGCTGDECTRADDQIATCAEATQETLPSASMDLSLACTAGSARLCQSKCINTHTCAEINASLCLGQVGCPELPASGDAGLSDFAACWTKCKVAAGASD